MKRIEAAADGRCFQKRNRMAFPRSQPLAPGPRRSLPEHRVSSIRNPITRAASLNLQDALAIRCRLQEVKKTLRGPAECSMP